MLLVAISFIDIASVFRMFISFHLVIELTWKLLNVYQIGRFTKVLVEFY